MKPVKDMTLLEQQPEAIATTDTAGGMAMFERLARDPSVDVDKLEKLMALHERASARFSEEQFNTAMSSAQTDMRPVAAEAYNPQTKSKYASYAALDRALRPIYTKHGFGLSFDTGEGAPELYVRVLCYVTHTAGHARTYHADIPADGKGAKGGDVMTRTHAVGAAMSYGTRYLLKLIFNVAVGEDDDDGNSASPKERAAAPSGYDAWWAEFQTAADEGLAVLRAAWDESDVAMRKHLTENFPQAWNELKKKAAKVGA